MAERPGEAHPQPTAADLAAARNQTIPDIVAADLRVLFCGINPSLYSAAVGYHFARPGNRFWTALHRSGFTPRLLRPDEQDQLLGLRLGITNIVARATLRADELTTAELAEGGRALRTKAAALRPQWLAVVGVTAYRVAFGQPAAAVGAQLLDLGQTRLWVLPNPSGLNASYQIDRLTAEFARLCTAAAPGGGTTTAPPAAR
jgi:TDG/mug DNA glycosylase family protein